MILSTSEFDFEIQHVPGSKNIVADFGSRYISESEYPVDSNLKEDFVFTWIHEQTIYPVPSIAIQHLCTEDNEQLSSYRKIGLFHPEQTIHKCSNKISTCILLVFSFSKTLWNYQNDRHNERSRIFLASNGKKITRVFDSMCMFKTKT